MTRSPEIYIGNLETAYFGLTPGSYFINTRVGQIPNRFNLNLLGWILVIFKIAIEVCALFYGLSFVFIGLVYLFIKPYKETLNESVAEKLPSVGIIFLCCNDIDPDAFESIEKLDYEGDLQIVVHDDSIDKAAQPDVNNLVDNLRRKKPKIDIQILRRPVKGGGKSSAVNYVLKETGSLYDYFILCDNDSTIMDARIIEKAYEILQAGAGGGIVFSFADEWWKNYDNPVVLISGGIEGLL